MNTEPPELQAELARLRAAAPAVPESNELRMPEPGALVTWQDRKAAGLRIRSGVVVERRGAECLVECRANRRRTVVHVPTDRLRVYASSHEEWCNRQGTA